MHVFDDAHQGAVAAQEFNLKHKTRKWWGRINHDFRHRKETYRKRDWLSHVLPCLSWLIGYPVRLNLAFCPGHSLDTVAMSQPS